LALDPEATFDGDMSYKKGERRYPTYGFAGRRFPLLVGDGSNVRVRVYGDGPANGRLLARPRSRLVVGLFGTTAGSRLVELAQRGVVSV
jgi:hypothetical protein